MPKAKSNKSAETCERVFQTALRLFVERGYAETTMRQIALETPCAVGLIYRYFPSKDDLAVELYARLAARFRREATLLPEGTLARRFGAAMRLKLDLISPHRDALMALAAAALDPSSHVSVFSTRTSGVRADVIEGFAAVIDEAIDAPRKNRREKLARLLFAAHLLLVLFWLHDASASQQKSDDAIAAVERLLAAVMPFASTPFFDMTLHALEDVVDGLFAPEPSHLEKTMEQNR